ncbi:MAG: MFS transporter [Armatimonadota bacterium]|nr:MFS transporter [Armatimonadota bacterium]
MNDPVADLQQYRYKWYAFAAAAIGVFMSTLDASIVNIGLPTFKQVFGAGLPTVQWVVMSYLLAITSVLLTLGRLGDMIGRRKVYVAGIVVFTVGSVLCGISPSIHALIVSRALQGIGASMLMAMGPAITTAAFPSSERGRALGMIGTVVAVGLTFGPAAGGYIIKYLGWRWIFFINVPVAVIGVPLIYRFLRESVVSREEKFDIPGAALLFFSLSCLLIALSYGNDFGWASWKTLALAAGFVTFGVLFIRWEQRVPNPVFHLELFRNKIFMLSSTAAYISFISLFSVAVYMPFYLMQALEFSPVTTGQILMLVPATMSFIAPLSGWLSDKFGPRVLSSIGMATMSIGLFSLSRLGVKETASDIIWRLLLAGIGSGIFQSPNTSAILGAVPRNMLGVASGMVAMMRNLGMVSGVALIGAVVSAQQAHYLSHSASASKAALVYGLQTGFLVAAGISIIGFIISAARGSSLEVRSG